MGTTSGLFSPLEDHGLIRLSGADAATLLQGQSTCDILALEPGSAGCGAFCTPQGRVIANFRITRQADDYFLWLARDLAEAVCRRLRLYVLRSSVTVENLSDSHTLMGLFGDCPAALSSRNVALHVNDSLKRTVLAIDGSDPGSIANLTRQRTVVDSNAWRLADIEIGWPSVTARISETFIPQMINLDLMGGISFSKGCYTGQEIVTRTRFLGQVKRRLYRLSGHGTLLPNPGDAISQAGAVDSGMAGQVVSAAHDDTGDGFQMLAVLAIDLAESPDLMLQERDDGTFLKREPLTLD